MKATIIFILFLLLSVTIVSAQETTIQVNLKQGFRYEYEKLDYTIRMAKGGIRDTFSIEKKVIRCDVEKVIPGEQIIVEVSLLQNRLRGPSRDHLFDADYLFPEFVSDPASERYFEELLCRVPLRYALNLKTRSSELLNKPELPEKFKEILIQKQLPPLFTDTLIQRIFRNNEIEKAGLASFLLWFHQSGITAGNQVANSLLAGRTFQELSPEGDLSYSEADLNRLPETGSLHKFRLDTASGVITAYLNLKQDPKQIPTVDVLRFRHNQVVNESRINLLASGKIPPEMVHLTAKIEQPLSNLLYISFLQMPFGIEFQKKTVYLDENGSFAVDFTFPHRGLIYIENENPNRYSPSATIVLYAEPGDTINFQANGNKLPRAVTFSGDRMMENKLLADIRSQIKIPNRSTSTYALTELLDREFISNYTIDFSTRKIIGTEELDQLIPKLNQTEMIIRGYQPLLNDVSCSFITNELRCYFYSAILRFLVFSELFPYPYADHRLAMVKQQMANFVDHIDVQSVYNDFGLQSRRMVSYYLLYYYNKNKKSGNPVTANYVFRSYFHADQYLNYAGMVLSGSPLYREMAAVVAGKNSFVPVRINREDSSVRRQLILRYYDLLLRKSNDNDFLNETGRIKALMLKSQAKDFIPEISFLNSNGKLTGFRDYFGKKPSIFHISGNWVGDRYYLDDKARENPELRFIMVVEGNSFREWSEYLKKAEPVAEQLLLNNDTVRLKDLFSRDHNLFRVYDKEGILLGNYESLDYAVAMARKSLEDRGFTFKAPLLKAIIMALTGILLMFVVVFFLWRMKVRRQLRKEQAQRHLMELELTAIRAQMNPHFLFNCLNSVQNLIQQNQTQEANRYLADFAGLIRKVLKNAEKEEVSLAEELESLQQYLNLEKLRFDFNFHFLVAPEIDTHNTMVPSMLLQPFAENAVIHGLQHKSGNRQLKVEVVNVDDGLKISIEDNGIGREAAKSLAGGKNGKGLKLMEERLEFLSQKQGERYKVEITDLNLEGETGTRVEIFIPEEK